MTTEKNNGTISTEVPVNGFLNNNFLKESEMPNNNENDIHEGLNGAVQNDVVHKGLSDAITNIDVKQVRHWVTQKGVIVNKKALEEAEDRLSTLSSRRTGNKKNSKKDQTKNLRIIIAFLKKELTSDSGINSASASGQTTPVSDDDHALSKVQGLINDLVDQVSEQGEEFFDAPEELNATEIQPDDSEEEVRNQAISTKSQPSDCGRNSGSTANSNHELAVATGQGVATVAISGFINNISKHKLDRDDIREQLQRLHDNGYSQININMPANGNISNTLAFNIKKMLENLEETVTSFPNLLRVLRDHRLLGVKTGDAHLSSSSEDELDHSFIVEDIPDEGNQTGKVPGAPMLELGYKPQSSKESFVNFVETPSVPTLAADSGNAKSSNSSGGENEGRSDVSLEDIGEEAGRLQNEQRQPSGEPDASSSSGPASVGGGAGSATDKGASPSTSHISNDGKQSDAAKKSARPYNVASLLLLGGGVGCGVLALSLYYACAVSALTAGIIAGVGVPLFLIAAAVVHFCKPQTLSKDSNVEKLVTGQDTSRVAPGTAGISQGVVF